MAICPDCGRPCHYCSAPDNVSILMFDSSIQDDLKYLTKSLNLTSKQAVDSFLAQMKPYPPKKIAQSIRKWRNGGYANTGKGPGYFMGILRNCCTEREPLLDDLPPRYKPPKEGDDADGQA